MAVGWMMGLLSINLGEQVEVGDAVLHYGFLTMRCEKLGACEK